MRGFTDYFWAVFPYLWMVLPGITAEIFWIASWTRGRPEMPPKQRTAAIIFLLGLVAAQALAWNDMRNQRDQNSIDSMTPRASYVEVIPEKHKQLVEEFSVFHTHYQISKVRVSCRVGGDERMRLCSYFSKIFSEAGLAVARETDFRNPALVPIYLKVSPAKTPGVIQAVPVLGKLIRSAFVVQGDKEIPDDTLAIFVDGQPTFYADGTVSFSE